MISWPIIGEGTTRTVYDLGDGTVVKICSWSACCGDRWSCHCAREATRWSAGGSPILAPILDSGTCWVRMPKADDIPKKHESRSLEQVFRLATEEGLCDLHPGNFGWFGNRLLCIDYAF